MRAGVTLNGFDELRRELHRMSEEIQVEARAIVDATAIAAHAAIDARLPVKSGGLRKRTRVQRPSSTAAVAVVAGLAPHAALIERGTQSRYTSGGAFRGRGPRTGVFAETAPRFRRLMRQRLVAMVRRHGFTVTGA